MKKPSNWRQRLLKFAVVCLLLLMLLRWFEHSQVYHPSRKMDAAGTTAAQPFEDVFFKTSDGVKLNGWYFAARTNSPRGHLAVLICHGNGGNISHRLGLYEVLLQTGAAIFAFDCRPGAVRFVGGGNPLPTAIGSTFFVHFCFAIDKNLVE